MIGARRTRNPTRTCNHLNVFSATLPTRPHSIIPPHLSSTPSTSRRSIRCLPAKKVQLATKLYSIGIPVTNMMIVPFISDHSIRGELSPLSHLVPTNPSGLKLVYTSIFLGTFTPEPPCVPLDWWSEEFGLAASSFVRFQSDTLPRPALFTQLFSVPAPTSI